MDIGHNESSERDGIILEGKRFVDVSHRHSEESYSCILPRECIYINAREYIHCCVKCIPALNIL